MKNWFQFLFSILLIVFSISTFADEPAALADQHAAFANKHAVTEHTFVHQPYARIVSFGDSLSDLGTYGQTAAAVGGGKFTTNPGPIWIEVIAAKLQLEVKPNRQEGFGFPVKEIGGFNYGQGGSRIRAAKSQIHTEKGIMSARPVAEQVDMFLTQHKSFYADDLVLIQGGANDLFARLSQIQGKKETPAQALQKLRQVAGDLAQIVESLKHNGAQKVVVVGLPAIEKTPRVMALSVQAQAWVRDLVEAFNTELAQKLTGLDVLFIDLYHFDLNFNVNYAQYGFKNISHQACKKSLISSGSSLFCSSKTLVEPGADMTYKFADEIHPSTGFSKVVGEFIFASIIPLLSRIIE